jgi:hypothetical protein
MKRLFVLLAALTALAAVLAGSALAGGNAAPKATGDITFLNTAYAEQGIAPATQAHWVFTAQQGLGSPAKGNMTYTDGYGSYTANVTGLTVSGPDATLSFVITSTTTPYAFVGETATFVLHDGGEPGVGHDYISNSSWTSPTITAGNLQVHA